eukprot:TRINITY_DN627_c6_g1_i1.p1 TRINITY_DN627_c6_g1~~TRINITY_DN627_c6_g1_i1.p1  ORF type:complete len:449 (+),score=196.12 TRINITY_DN627_c6_g1_i1:63-1409(+)
MSSAGTREAPMLNDSTDEVPLVESVHDETEQPAAAEEPEAPKPKPKQARPKVHRTEAEKAALKKQLEEFYQKYNADLLEGNHIDKIIDLGLPDRELFARLRAKYELDDDDDYSPHPQLADAADTEAPAVEEAPKALMPRVKDHMARKYSSYTTALLVPVSITMCIVVWAVTNFTPISQLQDSRPAYLYYKEKETDSSGAKFGGALLNALLIVAFIFLLTFIMVLLYKYRCMKILAGWLMLSTTLVLFFFGWIWFDLFCTKYQIPYDTFTAAFILFNFGSVGVMCIYFRGHPMMTQGYLIASSAIMAWWLTRLPEWTTWVLLFAVAAYDVFAVLSPKGPLKTLVEESQNRAEPIPGLVYESKQYKLGLGDFVFYSVLVGRAAKYTYLTWVVSFVAVLAGLCGTLFSLGMFKKALPALPFSIALGIVFYFTTRYFVVPYAMLPSTLGRPW